MACYMKTSKSLLFLEAAHYTCFLFALTAAGDVSSWQLSKLIGFD